MASVIKGVPIIYHAKTSAGVDAFNREIFTETLETINNVLITPQNTSDLTDATNLSETHTTYELCIPKGDTHEWRNVIVEFWGEKWQTVGDSIQYIESLVPLDWNRKVRVERYE